MTHLRKMMLEGLAALRFFYTRTIKKAWSVADTPYPKKTRHLPSILSPEEVAHLIDSSQTRFHRVVLMTLYGTGVRRAEIEDPDFRASILPFLVATAIPRNVRDTAIAEGVKSTTTSSPEMTPETFRAGKCRRTQASGSCGEDGALFPSCP
jgi:integrase